MIKIYDGADYNLTACKVNVVPTRAEITLNTNDEYYADIEIPLSYIANNGYEINYASAGIVSNDIAAIDTPWGTQCFRLESLEKSGDGFRCRAPHVSQELKRCILPTEITIGDEDNQVDLYTLANYVLEFAGINDRFSVSAPIFQGSFMTYSKEYDNGYNTITAYNAFKALTGPTVGIFFDNWHVVLFERNMEPVTPDHIFRNNKNLTDVVITENWDNVCTECLAIGYNNLRNVYKLTPNPYPCNFSRFMKFEPSDAVTYLDDDDEIRADLWQQAKKYVEAHMYPEVKYTVYAEPTEPIYLNTPILVQHNKLGVTLNCRVEAIKYDALAKKYISVEYGNIHSVSKRIALLHYEITRLKMRLVQGGL